MAQYEVKQLKFTKDGNTYIIAEETYESKPAASGGSDLSLVTTGEKYSWNAKANTNSPSFTGTPTVPTAEAGTNTTQAANTAFVTTAVTTVSNAKMNKPTNTGVANQILRNDGNGGVVWDNAATSSEISTAVTSWLNTNVPTGTTVAIDASLTVSGAAADAKVTGDVKNATNILGDSLKFNLIFDNTIAASKYLDASHTLKSSSSWRCWTIPTAGLESLFSLSLYSNGASYYAVGFYDENDTWISGVQYSSGAHINGKYYFDYIKVPDTAVWARVCNRKETGTDITVYGIRSNYAADVDSELDAQDSRIQNVEGLIGNLAAFSGERGTATGAGLITIDETYAGIINKVNANASCTVKLCGKNIVNALTMSTAGTRTKNFADIPGGYLLAGHTYYFRTFETFGSNDPTLTVRKGDTVYATVYGSYLSYTPTENLDAYFRIYAPDGYNPDDNKIVISIDNPIDVYTAPIDVVTLEMNGSDAADVILFDYLTAMATDPSAILTVNYYYKENTSPVVYAHQYSGERISLGNRYKYTPMGSVLINGQGGAIFGNEVFKISTVGTFEVYNIGTMSSAGSGSLPNAPHANTVFFGSQYYNASDDYPILYINSYVGDDLPKGTLYAYRITKSGTVFSATLVQTISIGFVNDTIWTPSSGEYRNSGNFLEDAENGVLWAYTQRSDETVTRFFSFTMPLITAGDVTLEKTDIISYFDVPIINVPQDGIFESGKIYVIGGGSGAGTLSVVNLQARSKVSLLQLYKAGITMEPEMIFAYNGDIYVSGTALYRLEFKD